MKNLARWRIVGVAIVLMFSASLAGAQEGKIVPYVPTPQDVVERMLELAKVKNGTPQGRLQLGTHPVFVACGGAQKIALLPGRF